MWFLRFHTRALPRVNVFCLPHAGGSASFFKDWSGDMTDSVQLFSAQLPGRENRIMEEPLTSISSIVDGLLTELSGHLDRPYMLYGHSMGAKLAFELIWRLIDEKQPLPAHLFVSGAPGPQVPRRKPRISHLPRAEFLEELRKYDGTAEQIFENEELQELFLPVLRADFKIVEDYQCSHEGRAIPTRTTVYAGLDDTHVALDDVEQWRDVARVVSSKQLSGGHFFLQSHRRAIIDDIETTAAGLA